MYRTLSLAAALVCAQPLVSHAAPDIAEGRELYQQFRCADCHGADARARPGNNVAPLAGMDADHVFMKTKRFIESRAHDNVLQGCGEPPSHIQIKKISDYLATLPR